MRVISDDDVGVVFGDDGMKAVVCPAGPSGRAEDPVVTVTSTGVSWVPSLQALAAPESATSLVDHATSPTRRPEE